MFQSYFGTATSNSRRIQHIAHRSNTFQKLHFSFDGTNARATSFWLKTLLVKFILLLHIPAQLVIRMLAEVM